MENILKKSSGRAERFVLAYAIVVVMVFGVLNPLTYVTDFNTAQEISGMGKVVNMDTKTSVYKGYKRDKIEMRGDRAEISDFPLYLNTVAGGLDCRDQTIGGFSFVVKIYAVPVVEIIG